MTRLLGAVFLALMLVGGADAAPSAVGADEFPDLAFTQHPGAPLPLSTALRDETGRLVRLGAFFGLRPVVLALGYFHCPNLCGLTLEGLVAAVDEAELAPGRDFDVLAISIDPRETSADANAAKEKHLSRSKRPEAAAGWHFLTGDEDAVRHIADRVGFAYVYDPAIDQYAHPAGVVLATPAGTVSRYLLGVDYAPLDLRLGLVESSRGRIAAPAARLLLLCYGYDPTTGRYTMTVMRLVQAAGILGALALAAFVGLALRRERR